MRDPYEVLGVPRSANAAAIKSAYRKLAKKHHPDSNKGDPKAAERFAEINSANEILGDEDKRKQFDRGEIDADGKPRFQGFPGGGGPRGRAGPGGFESYTFRSGGAGGGPGGGAFEDILNSMSADGSDCVAFQDQPITQLLVKVATRCNIDCSYCYWFRDASVYTKPKLMSPDVQHRLLQRIEEHVVRFSLADFPVILHGGEPLLWGVENFHGFAEACEAISSRTGCGIPIAVTTNGVLIDDEWLACFEARNISVAISVDGPAHIHDLHRRTFQGTGTHAPAKGGGSMIAPPQAGVISPLRSRY